jgi:hypothetical protein
MMNYFDASQESNVPRVIITARVEDSASWEADFRTHKEIFNDYTATAIHFTVTDDNELAILWEVADSDTFLQQLESPASAEAMGADGVIRESVKVFVLDKDIDL